MKSFNAHVDARIGRAGGDVRSFPAWAREGDAMRQIAAVYREAWLIGREVDHLIPICGYGELEGELVQVVSGLTVPANLMIVSKHWNRSKCNYWPVASGRCMRCGGFAFGLRLGVCSRRSTGCQPVYRRMLNMSRARDELAKAVRAHVSRRGTQPRRFRVRKPCKGTGSLF